MAPLVPSRTMHVFGLTDNLTLSLLWQARLIYFICRTRDEKFSKFTTAKILEAVYERSRKIEIKITKMQLKQTFCLPNSESYYAELMPTL